MSVSVLMTTYHGEQASRLARSLESIYVQTTQPNELVLVVDGGIDTAQEDVVARYGVDNRVPMRVVRLDKNQGLGSALKVGLRYCNCDWIMRMDSDDIATPDRLEAQLAFLERHPEYDLVGGWSEEFFEDAPDTRLKTAPTDCSQLVRALRLRNVIVHPSVLMRTHTVRQVGGYDGRFPLLEDWDLFTRMAMADAKLIVLPRVVIRVSTGHQQAARRGGWTRSRSDIRFRTHLWRQKFISFPWYVGTTIAFAGYTMAGARVRNYLYRFVRTKSGGTGA